MSSRIFRKGGPNRIKRLRGNQYSMTVSIPKDRDGRMARECPNGECSPGYFKVTPGTGITNGHVLAFCPYCRHEGEPNDFTTQEQLRYAKDLVLNEAQKGVQSMFQDALGLGPSGKRKMGGGFVSIEMSFKPGTLPPVRRPFEDEVRRDVVCPHCGLDQTVFGLATWCADCGEDIFMTHVAGELAVTRTMLGDVNRREEALGKRVMAKDLENCLEDAVSLFEAAVRAIVRRGLTERGLSTDDVDACFKRLGNAFQNVSRTRKHLTELFGFTIEDTPFWTQMGQVFEKRHPIAHNLGVVDRKYLERAQQAEREGREVRITSQEIDVLLKHVEEAVRQIRDSALTNGVSQHHAMA